MQPPQVFLPIFSSPDHTSLLSLNIISCNFCDSLFFSPKKKKTLSHISMQEKTSLGGWGRSCEPPHVYLYLFVGCLNLLLPRGKGKLLQREKRERSCFDTGVWTWIVGWFPAQSACGFHSPWHAISPQSTSTNPPLNVSFSLTISLSTSTQCSLVTIMSSDAQICGYEGRACTISLSRTETFLMTQE